MGGVWESCCLETVGSVWEVISEVVRGWGMVGDG